MFQSCVEDQNTRFMFDEVLSKIMPFMRQSAKKKKYCRARQVTDGNKIWRMHCASWITKATDTHSEYVIKYLLIFHSYCGYAKAPRYYIYTYPACITLLISGLYLEEMFTFPQNR